MAMLVLDEFIPRSTRASGVTDSFPVSLMNKGASMGSRRLLTTRSKLAQVSIAHAKHHPDGTYHGKHMVPQNVFALTTT
jgi:hypothetical protein